MTQDHRHNHRHDHHKAPVVVAGGTGNVGGFIVRALLEKGETVVVPSRSPRKIERLKTYLDEHLPDLRRLHTIEGSVSDAEEGTEIAREVVSTVGSPRAVIALMGSWRSSDTILQATEDDFDYVLEHYLKAHFGVARSFLPVLNNSGGTFVFVNGPLAFEVWPRTALVSIATAAQHMLFRTLAKEHDDTPTTITELVTYAFIRDRQTQEGSPIPGEAVGVYASHLVSGEAGNLHGRSFHLKSLDLLAEAGISVPHPESLAV